jgi:hypothetical protein
MYDVFKEISMGRMKIDLNGQKYERLTVVSFVGIGNKGDAMWLCRCDCGTFVTVACRKLRGGSKKSCGCLSREWNEKNLGLLQLKHGGTHTRLYSIWHSMRQRCNNVNASNYKDYGGKGVKICKEWNEFAVFREWALKNGYTDGLSIDRIDGNKDYCPENCQWATRKEQSVNRKSVILIEYGGEKLTSVDWSRKIGGNDGLVGRRLKMGWPIEKAITTPPDKLKLAKGKR